MEKKILWIKGNDYNDNEGVLLDPEDFTDKILAYDWDYRQWSGVPYSDNIKLPEIVTDSYGDEVSIKELDRDELIELLDKIVGTIGEQNEEYANPDDCLAYDFYEKCFFNPSECDTYKVYEWWDGHNWKKDMVGEDDDIIKVTLESKYDLDYWDGHNNVYGGVGLHANLHKIITIDGEPVEDKILWESWSQWQGSQTTGEIMTVSEVIESLTENEHPNIDDVKAWLGVVEE